MFEQTVRMTLTQNVNKKNERLKRDLPSFKSLNTICSCGRYYKKYFCYICRTVDFDKILVHGKSF